MSAIGPGEKFLTLDGQKRRLDENVLMICDTEQKAVGIPVVIGGENYREVAALLGKNQIRP